LINTQDKTYWDYVEKIVVCNWDDCNEVFKGLDRYSDAVEHVQTQHFSHCLCCETECESIIIPEGYCCIQGGREDHELCDYCKDRNYK